LNPLITTVFTLRMPRRKNISTVVSFILFMTQVFYFKRLNQVWQGVNDKVQTALFLHKRLPG